MIKNMIKTILEKLKVKKPKSNGILSNIKSRDYTFYRVNRTHVIYNGDHLELIGTKVRVCYFDYMNNKKYSRKYIDNLHET